jgi:RNA polymerase sigma-70 factor, ECF subfamily
VSDTGEAAAAITEVFRREYPAALATLVRQVGDLQLAEDALQDAFVDAAIAWPRDGVPGNPRGWLQVTARRRAIDRIRRHRSYLDRAVRFGELLRRDTEHPEATADPEPIPDDRLRLIFTCCHPALDISAQVALTLRTVAGLTTAEIARAFLVTEPTMGKRITRAKRKIAAAGIPYEVPGADDLPARLRGVLLVVYLVFNEGYRTDHGDRLIRGELCGEAIGLARTLVELLPGDAEALGLLALMLLNDARSAARVDDRGRYVALADQDRAQWNSARIDEGLHVLSQATRLGPPGEYVLQAAISAAHMVSGDADAPDRRVIAELYEALLRVAPSVVVRLNHAAAVGYASGPEAGMALLRPLLDDPALARYQPLHATHAELLRRRGDPAGAAAAYRRALDVTGNTVERDELRRRLAALEPP